MCAARYLPTHSAELHNGLVAWVRSEVGLQAVWAAQSSAGDGQTPPSPPVPFVRLQWITPPAGIGQGDRRQPGLGLVVLEAVDETDYALEVDGNAIVVNSGTDATIASIRDAIVEAVNALDDSGLGARAIGAAGLVVGFVPATTPPTLPTIVVDEEAGLMLRKLAQVTHRNALGTLAVDVFGDAPQSALPLSAALSQSLETETTQAALRAAGWAIVDTPGARKGDAIVGGVWEDRAGFDLRLYCGLRAFELLDWIEDPGIPVGTWSY